MSLCPKQYLGFVLVTHGTFALGSKYGYRSILFSQTKPILNFTCNMRMCHITRLVAKSFLLRKNLINNMEKSGCCISFVSQYVALGFCSTGDFWVLLAKITLGMPLRSV